MEKVRNTMPLQFKCLTDYLNEIANCRTIEIFEYTKKLLIDMNNLGQVLNTCFQILQFQESSEIDSLSVNDFKVTNLQEFQAVYSDFMVDIEQIIIHLENKNDKRVLISSVEMVQTIYTKFNLAHTQF